MKLFQNSQFYCMIVEIYASGKEITLNCVHGKNMDGVYLSIWRFQWCLLNAVLHLLSSVSVTS